MKPWDPPDQNLYPVLDELLDDWQAAFRPPFEGMRVIGHRWSPLTHQIKDFLARNQVPYHWSDVETDEESQQLVQSLNLDAPQLPAGALPRRLLPDAAHQRPDCREGRAADCSAEPALLRSDHRRRRTCRAGGRGLRRFRGPAHALIEREAPGGQAGTSSRIENYLGFPAA